MPVRTDSAGRRLALLVATSEYRDPALRQLRSPGRDARDLGQVLGDPQIGDFDVQTLLDAGSGEVQEGIEDFCADRHPDDQLLIYLSCHGVLDDFGRLYYAAVNTRRLRLAATAVPAAWLNERLEDCRARRQIVVLDCCHSGAFARGSKGEPGLALQQRFEPHGRGRVVLTASRSTEYSFEGDQSSGDGVPSVFTRAIVEGLITGNADRDMDGLITVNDLYRYVYDNVRSAEPRQTPELWTYGAEGDLLVARSVRGAVIEPVSLPENPRVTLESPRSGVRQLPAIRAAGAGVPVLAPVVLAIPLYILALNWIHNYKTNSPWQVMLGAAALGIFVSAAEYRRSRLWATALGFNFLWCFLYAVYRLVFDHPQDVPQGSKVVAVLAGVIVEVSLCIVVLIRMRGRGQSKHGVHWLLPLFLACMAVGLGIEAIAFAIRDTSLHWPGAWALLAALLFDMPAPLRELMRIQRSSGREATRLTTRSGG